MRVQFLDGGRVFQAASSLAGCVGNDDLQNGFSARANGDQWRGSARVENWEGGSGWRLGRGGRGWGWIGAEDEWMDGEGGIGTGDWDLNAKKGLGGGGEERERESNY